MSVLLEIHVSDFWMLYNGFCAKLCILDNMTTLFAFMLVRYYYILNIYLYYYYYPFGMDSDTFTLNF